MEDRALTDLDAEIEQMERAMMGTPEQEPTPQAHVEQPEVIKESTPEVITQDLQAELDTAQKRFNNFKASADITIRNSRIELQDLRSQVGNLQAEIARLKSSAEPSKDVSSYFSQEDREILGETAVEALDRSVKDIVDSKVNPLQEQLDREKTEKEALRKQQAEDRAQEAMNLFATRLASVVPDYQAILGRQDFFTWIDEVDPLSGYTRKDLFTRAEAEGDVARVASFFNEFKGLTTSRDSALEEHVIPTGVTGTVPETEAKPEFAINEVFIDKFYDDLSRGDIKYKGKKGRALAERTEAAIDEWVSSQFRR